VNEEDRWLNDHQVELIYLIHVQLVVNDRRQSEEQEKKQDHCDV
jgi:hypothetical protein